ncbi:MAG: hypothetical protein AB8B60_10585 [Sulfitobacter sp.]
MSDKPKFVPGQIYQPPKQEVTASENEVRGPTWRAWREDGFCYLEFLASRHGGGSDRYVIFDHELEGLKDGTLSFDDVRKRYDVV